LGVMHVTHIKIALRKKLQLDLIEASVYIILPSEAHPLP